MNIPFQQQHYPQYNGNNGISQPRNNVNNVPQQLPPSRPQQQPSAPIFLQGIGQQSFQPNLQSNHTNLSYQPQPNPQNLGSIAPQQLPSYESKQQAQPKKKTVHKPLVPYRTELKNLQPLQQAQQNVFAPQAQSVTLESDKTLQLSAEEGDAVAQPVTLESVKTLEFPAEERDAVAQCNLGLMHEHGLGGLVKDDVKAVYYYRLSADQGNAQAQCNLGVMYEQGRGGLEENPIEGLHWVLKSKQPEGKAGIRNYLPLNINAPMGAGGESFIMTVEQALSEIDDRFNPHIMLPGSEYMRQPLIEANSAIIPLLQSLGQAKGGLMVSAVDLHQDLVTNWLHRQITPSFSRDVVEGTTYLTLGEENVCTAKQVTSFLNQLDNAEKHLQGMADLIQTGRDELTVGIHTLSPSLKNIREGQDWFNFVKSQVIKLIDGGQGSRNDEFFEEYPLTRD